MPLKLNLNKNLQRLKEYQWYRQGAAVKLLYISYPWKACLDLTVFGRRVPFYYNDLLVYRQDNYMTPFFRWDVMKKVADYYSDRQKKDSRFIFKLFDNWLKNYVRPYRKYLEKLEKAEFADWDDQELLKEFWDFSRVYMREWRESIFLDSFDLWGDKLLQQEIKQNNLTLPDEDFQVLTSQDKPSFMQQEQIDLAKIIKKYRESAKIRKAISQEKNMEQITKISPEFHLALAKHSAKYHWLMNDFATVTRLSPGYYFRKIKSLPAGKKNLDDLCQMGPSLEKVRKYKREVAKKLGLSGQMIKTFDFFNTLASWRDHRKSYNQMAGGAIEKFAQEFSKRTGIPMAVIECMFHWEVKDIFCLNKKDLRIYKERQKPAFYFSSKGPRVEYVTGRPAQKVFGFFNNIILKKQQLKGAPAYKGMVRGRARLILSQKDFSKMRKGDVVIAHNTRPEFLSIMKIASAFVTEEGGLTCHAAIIARELKTPCIVGVQGVTSVLKDGDKVEVDAGKGVIRAIK